MWKMSLNYVLIIISVSLFFYGFFPISQTTEKFDNEPPNYINQISLRRQEIYTSNISRTVLIIIDALRLDFVNENYMPLTSKLLKNKGCFSKVKVEIPTVTLPRIKALTTGDIPQFIDLVLNLASTEVLKDSLLNSARKSGKKIVLYGDNTWINLFPDHFTRYEGTNSFFVKDFKEVDDNVTRNVNTELEKEDWDMMILHYLGLDHIGHVYGPFSPLVPHKLKEMDEIIHKIHTKISKTDNTLLVVTGDHGMRDSGGHGGSTFSETNVPLLLVGLYCKDGSMDQTDIPVNLAVLLGVNIPSTSIGRIRRNLLPFTLEQYLYVLRYNNLILKQKTSEGDDHFDLATAFHERYLKHSDEESSLKAVAHYQTCSDIISESLARSSTQQNSNSLTISILVMLNVLAGLLVKMLTPEGHSRVELMKNLFLLVVLCIQILYSSDIIVFIMILALLSFLVINMLPLVYVSLKISCSVSTFFVLFSFLHPLTLFSTSFIEEEHQFWYFSIILFIFGHVIYFYKIRNFIKVLQYFSLLVTLRFLRTFNSTGYKWGSNQDFSDWLVQIENYYYHLLFFIFGLSLIFYAQYYLTGRKIKINITNFIILSSIFIFKNNEANILLARFIWFSILCHLILFSSTSKIVTWTLISSLILKPYNVVLLSFCVFSSLLISKQYKKTEILTLYHTWLGNMLYFAQGHSNSLASVEVSVGYIGLSQYQPLLVILQVLCHTYCFPVLCHLLLFRNEHTKKRKAWDVLFCNRLYVMIAVCILTFLHRYHLFIWSVFAPKLFIESVHTVFLFIEYCLYLLDKYFSSFVNSYKTNIPI